MDNKLIELVKKNQDLSLKIERYKLKEQLSDYKIYNLGADTGTTFLVINLNNILKF